MGVTQRTIRRPLTGHLSSKYFVYFAGIVPLELHETERQFYGERTFTAHCCTGNEHIGGFSKFYVLRMVPKNNDNKDNPWNPNYGE